MAWPRASTILFLAAAGCEEGGAHLFNGYPYDQLLDCLLPLETIDVIAGPAPRPCSTVACWTGPNGAAYITDGSCDGPANFQKETEDSSGPCVKALAAYRKENGAGRCAVSQDGGLREGS